MRLLGVIFLITALTSIHINKLYANKPRLFILTDIGGDPDDIQSLRRLLLYSNEFCIEGIAATATRPKGSKENQTKENLIFEALNDYEKVYRNLTLHAEGYPGSNSLKSVVCRGHAKVGIGFLTAGNSSEASKKIIQAVDQSDENLNIAIWGGSHDLAQALLDVKNNRSAEETNLFISKLRIYSIADQYPGGFTKGTGQWIKENFPYLFYVEGGPPWMVGHSCVFRGMYQNDSRGGDHPGLPLVKPGVEELNNTEWLKKNVLTWGALGEGYPSNVKQNPDAPRNTNGVKEGDTPSWFYFLPNGLSDIEHPQWGCWGGRFEHVSGAHFADAQDDHWSGVSDGAVRRKWTVARWREAFQNDFAARMRWCTLSFEEANHNPIAIIGNDGTKQIVNLEIEPGQKITIDASGSSDPDRDKIGYNWCIYQEASSSVAILKNTHESKVELLAQEEAPAGEIHVILEVKDNGVPSLISYRRIIVKVLGNN